ncbi:MAG: hypothetical protein HY287_16055 [Planctomycetes bacterium]|nr:hypothetical protein [Planctomycetota bacterium]
MTAVIVPVAQGQKWADDLTFGPGAPCELLAYDVVVGGIANPVTNFDVHLELWTNNDNATPGLDDDDIPLALIPGTEFDAHGIPADALRHTLFVSTPPGIILPKKVWLVMTSTAPGGPEFGGLADIGHSLDAFAIFNQAQHPNIWTPLLNFGGFDPTYCPEIPNDSGVCVPAGSFRADVWCKGNPPVGACCSASSGTCRENVAFGDCHGRWAEGETCESAAFDPPCGASACCYKFPPNPTFILCQDFTAQDCAANLGESAPKEQFCNNTTCPRAACINVTGSCTAVHATTGCDDGYCCDKVCAADSFCCATSWDSSCVTKAQQLCPQLQNNDDCVSAKSISGPDNFNFDNTNATTDGPDHLACLFSQETQIANDVWFCWHSTCSGQVFVRTCDGTTLDTKLAVYDGCTCPPTDNNLLQCNDDLCGLESMSVISAVPNHDYLIRVGVFPGSATGTGLLSITCGAPANPSCPGAGDCCTAHASGAAACSNTSCCNSVCACDTFCCTTEWDDGCATNGYQGSGCGATAICGGLCGPNCPVGPVNFTNPVNGAVDARIPNSIDDANQRFGITTITATAPPGAATSCWSFCETQNIGTPNSISNVSENSGTYTITLARPITSNAVTTISYTNSNSFKTIGQFIAHPSNVNGVNTADVQDLLDLISAIKGSLALPYGLLSTDIDRSGRFTPLDLLEEVNLFNGAGAYQAWSGTPLPSAGRTCP